MTSRPAKGASTANTVHLATAQAGAELQRHPNDGWRLADPYPLGPRARAALYALIDALCPRGNAPRSQALMDRVEVGTRTLLRYMHPTVARALWFGLLLLDWLPVLTLKSPGRLHRLGPERASAFVNRWMKSRVKALRLLIMGIRSLVLSVYFDQTEVHEAMGYRPVALRRSLLVPAHAAAE
jgi:hypothetical protein